MHSTKTQKQFIQLRAEGLSLSRISAQLRVSKPTLLKWGRWFDEEIEDLTALERESSHEKIRLAHQADLTRLAKLHDTFETELAARNLSEITTEKLFRLAESLRAQIQSAQERSRLLEKQTPDVPDGLTRSERHRRRLNDLRVLHGLNPIDEDGDEYEIHRKPQNPPEPATSVNKQETSPENPAIS